MAHRPTLGIALGSGSARGWAHIGVLRALTEAGIAPDFVAGCSMGAMVGAAFAAGRIEELEAWALSLDWRRVVGLVDVGLRGGVFKGDRLLNIYQGQFVECPFSELSVPFAAVATDLATGQEVWLREGKVSDAVRASCTVPGLFRPVLRDGRYLIDGSVVNPIPVSLCRAMGAQVVIAVDLGTHKARRFPLEPPPASTVKSQRRGFFNILGPSPPPEVRPLPSITDTLLGAIDIMQERIAQTRLVGEAPEVLLTPQLGRFGPFEYHRATLAIEAGREIVVEMLPAIQDALAA
ncbi:MAG TPA: patatin-like phospholipase family protein [Casimicrobiaceae bacterium]|nr:patatin-like phospholipase family protein [Casimicrobiaceae bacterium]